jgi:broad specificity phosphatase PhoE
VSHATLYLVRHGESVSSGKRRVAGQLDPPRLEGGSRGTAP